MVSLDLKVRIVKSETIPCGFTIENPLNGNYAKLRVVHARQDAASNHPESLMQVEGSSHLSLCLED